MSTFFVDFLFEFLLFAISYANLLKFSKNYDIENENYFVQEV